MAAKYPDSDLQVDEIETIPLKTINLDGVEKTTDEQWTLKTIYNELPETISKILEPMGRYQVLLLVLLAANSIIIGINHTLTSFHTYTPAYTCNYEVRPWWCW